MHQASRGFGVVALLVAATGCGEQVTDGAGQQSSPLTLSFSSGAPSSPFTPNNLTGASTTVPVCWLTPGWAAQKEWIRRAVARTWSRVARVDFTGWDACVSDGVPRVRVQILSGDNGNFQLGTAALSTSGATGTFYLSTSQSIDRVRYLGVHEFGHVLGFPHEQDSPERDSDCSTSEPWAQQQQFGDWDRRSVMNSSGTCNAFGNGRGYLSNRDVAAVRQIYGYRKVRASNDFDGNGTSDIGVWRPGNPGIWYVEGIAQISQGTATSKAVPADYDGDGKADFATYDPNDCQSPGCLWTMRLSSNGTTTTLRWGEAGDVPVPGDYNGDGFAAPAVWRPASGTWYTSDCGGCSGVWGQLDDIPVPGDYDSDGVTDRAVFRPSNGNWYVSRENGAYNVVNFGTTGDIPVPGDYAGEGMVRAAVFRPSTGQWLFSVTPNSPNASGVYSTVHTYGANGDIPIPGDMAGTGMMVPRLWRPATGKFIYPKGGARTWGANGDTPLPRGIN